MGKALAPNTNAALLAAQVFGGNISGDEMTSVLRVVALIFLCMTLGSVAVAHTDMVQSEPAKGETVSAGLEKISLTFAQPVRVTVVKVTRVGQATEIPHTSTNQPAFDANYTLALEPLAPGRYRVDWTAVAQDGHVMTAQFEFSVAD